MDALDAALSHTKALTEQLITLATGVITLSITFTKDIAEGQVKKGLGALKTAWVLYLISILFGLLALMAISAVALNFAESYTAAVVTSAKGSTKDDLEHLSKIAEAREASAAATALRSLYVTAPAMLQAGIFLAGTIAILVHGFRSFKMPRPQRPPANTSP
jgi:hypothetical protein